MVSDVLEYAVRGVPIGCVFALLAVGLVLNYKTSGVFNLAFAAQAYASGAVFYVVRKEHNWPLLPAALLAVVVVSAAVGVLLDRVLYRHQRTASPLAKLITSLGLLVAVPEMIKLAIGSDAKLRPPPLWPVARTDDLLWPASGRFVLDAGQIATLVTTAVVVVGLVVLFRRGSLGLRMRAVVESPRLVQLQGIDAERVSLMAWVLSSVLAGLAGVLIAPLFAQLNSLDFFTLLVAAIAACVLGNLSSIALTFAGGILLGVLQAELAGFLPTDSILATGLRPSLPFVVLFALLLFRRSVRSGREVADPLAGVDPPPNPPVAETRPHWMTVGTRSFAVVAAAIGLAIAWFVLNAFWLGLVTAGVCLAVVLLSMVVTTGVGGTISLSQAAFAAVGAFTTAQLTNVFGVPVLVAVVIGALVAAVVGAVVGLPVIRLPGIYAALATLAFALFFESVIVPLGWVSGGAKVQQVPRPVVAGIHLDGDRSFLVLAIVSLAALGAAAIAVRQGTTGRFLDAIRGSQRAAASVGIDGRRAKLVAFVAGAAIAGFGGGLLASFYRQANYDQSFTFFIGLVWLVLVITAGARSVQSAVVGGLSFFLFPEVLQRLFAWPGHYLGSHPSTSGVTRSVLDFVQPEWSLGVAFILFGLGALTYAKHPEGIIEHQTAGSVRRVVARVERRRRPADVPTAQVPEVAPR